MNTVKIDRMESIRKARSLNELLTLVKHIERDIEASSTTVNLLNTSLSAAKIPQTSELVVDYGRTRKFIEPSLPNPTQKSKVKINLDVPERLGVKLAKWVPPPVEKIKSNVAVINGLHGNSEEADAITSRILQLYPEESKGIIARLKAAQDKKDLTLDTAFAALSSIAKRHLPTEMGLLSVSMVDYIHDIFEAARVKHGKMQREVLVTLGPKRFSAAGHPNPSGWDNSGNPEDLERKRQELDDEEKEESLKELKAEIRASLKKKNDLLVKKGKPSPTPEEFQIQVAEMFLVRKSEIETEYESRTAERLGVLKEQKAKLASLKTLPPKKIKIAVKSPARVSPKVAQDNSDIQFCDYISIYDLTNTSGYVLKRFCFVLTGLVDSAGTIRYYINGLNEFIPPGKYPLGAEIDTDEQLILQIRHLLSTHDVAVSFDRKPLSFTTQHIKERKLFKMDHVEDSYQVDNALYLVLKTGEDTPTLVANIVAKTVPILNLLVSPQRKEQGIVHYKTHREPSRTIGNKVGRSMTIQHKQLTRKGHTVLEFIVTPNLPQTEDSNEFVLNVETLKVMESNLGLTKTEVESFMHVLKQRQGALRVKAKSK